MKHKTLFRLMLKAVGVWLVVLSAPRIVEQLLVWGGGAAFGAGYGRPYWSGLISSALQVAAGLYLFFDGRWVADRAIPANRPYCHECGYDLTAATGNICNECGTPFRAAAPAASR